MNYNQSNAVRVIKRSLNLKTIICYQVINRTDISWVFVYT